MNSRHRKTLAAVFTDPVLANIPWSAIKALLTSVGCRMREGSGSRVRFDRDGEYGWFHRPHPGQEAREYQVKLAREFLERLGERP